MPTPLPFYVPTCSVFALKNYCMDPAARVTAATPYSARYPATNLLNYYRSERWRAPSTAAITVGFDMGTIVTPNVFGAVDLRAWTGSAFAPPSDFPGSVNFIGANDAAFSSGLVQIPMYYYNFRLTTSPADALSSQQGVSVQYSDYDGSGVAIPGRRFWGWQVTSFFGGSSSFIECGLFWFGRRWEIPVDTKFRTQSESNSTIGSLDSGAKYFDKRRRGRSVSLTTTTKETDQQLAFRAAVEQAEAQGIIADLWAFRINPADGTSYPERFDGMFYGYLDGRTQWEMRTVKAGRFNFNIDEAIA